MTSHRFQQVNGRVACSRCGATADDELCTGVIGMRVTIPSKFVRRTGIKGTGKVVGYLSPDIVLATVPGRLFPYPFALTSIIQQEVEHVSPFEEEVTDY